MNFVALKLFNKKKASLMEAFLMVPTERVVLARKALKVRQLAAVTCFLIFVLAIYIACTKITKLRLLR